MNTRTFSRLLMGAVLVLACVAWTNTGRSMAGFTPAIPLISYNHNFDHHWYVWLPRHPTYKAVEVMTIDAPHTPYRLVWVFFTEREGAKRQHHFMDDPLIAQGTDYFHYREIDYRRTGESGEGHNVHVSFTGLDGVPIEVEIDAEGVPLTRDDGGSHNQSGHGADRVVMLFHRKRTARTERNRVLMDGQDFSFRAGDELEGQHPFIAAYTAGIQLVVFPFGQWPFAASEAGSATTRPVSRSNSRRGLWAPLSSPTCRVIGTAPRSSWMPTARCNDTATTWARTACSSR